MRFASFRWSALSAFAVAVALLTSSADAAEKGNITGNVLTLDGKPAVSFVVKLVQDQPLRMTRPGRKNAGTDSGAVGLQGAQSGPTKVVAQTTTDAQGRFAFNNIEVGQYRLEGGNKNVGWLYWDVTVEANKTVEVKDLKLVKLD